MRIYIEGAECKFFTSGSITLKLDSIASTFEFAARFSANNVDHQEMFKPLQYKEVTIFNSKDKLVFTGTILNHRFKSNKGRELVVISGYSKSGILEDVNVPISAYPLESNGRSIKDIADRLCGLFGIKVVISDQVKTVSDSPIKAKKNTIKEKSTYETLKAKSNVVYGRTSIGPAESVKDYLAKIVGQKNIILSHNQHGDVLLFQPDLLQKPLYFFTKGNSISMTTDYNGQALHSEVNIVRQPSDENEGVSATDVAKNSLVAKYRPTTKVLSSGDDTDTNNAALNEVASELKAIECTVVTQGLLDEIYPGEIVNVHNHYTYNYAYNRWMVDSITLKFDESEDTTTLNLVPPEAFNGGPVIRNLLFNHQDEDAHTEPTLNENFSLYTNDKTIL